MTHSTMTPAATREHPAKFHPKILDAIGDHARGRVLDGFAGEGGIHRLADEPQLFSVVTDTIGVELEPEGVRCHPRTIQGDATALPFPRASFDTYATSPPYGNRMADRIMSNDRWTYHTYWDWLGRPCSPGSIADLDWGDDYRGLMRKAWAEADRVLRPRGLFIVNVKDFQADHKRVHAVDWHQSVIADLGYTLLERRQIKTPNQRHGTNAEVRYPEELLVFRKDTP